MAKAVDTIVGHHTLPAELQHDISNFSITGYATDHFKKQKKWGLFGRKYIKPEQIVISYSKKYTTSLTVLSPANEKRALAMYALICSYMETEISISDRKFCEVTMEINRCMEAGMIDEVYCTLIKQTTDNPHERSMERGWELLCAASMICQPTNPLMRVVAGHSTNMRFMPNPTGALAMAVHSLLCGHLKHLEVGSEQPPILRVDELSLDEHIIPLKKFWLPEKSYGCRVEQVILHEVYHRNPDGVCPLYTELMYSRDAVPE
ncbi:hum-6, partial [Symbiodinium microadriaticum]